MADYLQRASRYNPIDAQAFPSEDKFLLWLTQLAKKGKVRVGLFDPEGKLLTSEELAEWIGASGVDGTQQLVLAIGPADGWSSSARAITPHLISFGRITLPHELAKVVAAEQLYRAMTLIAGHPYHSGH